MANKLPRSVSNALSVLEAANNASERVAALHIAFLALCTYILVIVFSTTDIDLLVGKGVKLPLIDVDVPITGFYAVTPYLLVLIHFNLLLQLQLLSRKLYAVDQVIGTKRLPGGLRDQLHSFPFNYYLVGRPGVLVRWFIALLVTTTVLLLPLLVLVVVQARFLAYQSIGITWAQRLAVWIDVVLVTIFWPIIMDRQESWKQYMRFVWQHVKLHWLLWAWRFSGFAMLLCLLRIPIPQLVHAFVGSAFLVWSMITFFALPARRFVPWVSFRHNSALQANLPRRNTGLGSLLTVILLGVPLPLFILVDGEFLDVPDSVGSIVLSSLRHLELSEQILTAKQVKPEILSDLRGYNQTRKKAALIAIEPLDLHGRSFRHANFSNAVLAKANLRSAVLQEANLREAELLQADLSFAQLQTAQIMGAKLQGADLKDAHLQGANMGWANLQGANLARANLEGSLLGGVAAQGAVFKDVSLEGAYLSNANLQGANLARANFKGAEFRYSLLQGANLTDAKLHATDLQEAEFYSDSLASADILLADARGLIWNAFIDDETKKLLNGESDWQWKEKSDRDFFLNAVHAVEAGKIQAPAIKSCLRDKKTQLRCEKVYSFEQFQESLHYELSAMACQSRYIAIVLLAREDSSMGNAMHGFGFYFTRKMDLAVGMDNCPMWTSLSESNIQSLKQLYRQKQQ